MISSPMKQQLNEQLNREFFSAFFYLSMSARSESQGLKGTANWFMAKYQEEIAHAMKMYRYLLDQGTEVELMRIEQPPADYTGVLDMFEKTLAHEQGVTGNINELVDVALAEKDHATQIFLQWFVTEQIEEEAVVNDIIARLRLVGGQGEGLFMVDNELARMAQQLAQSPAGSA